MTTQINQIAKLQDIKHKKSNTYSIYIKSHCSAPDFEREFKAENIEEAYNKARKMIGNNWTNEMLFGKVCLMEGGLI